MRRSKDPPTFIVLFEDTAALLGLLIAFIGTLAAEWFAMPVLDGVAAIGISLVLAVTALALARESKGLLIGEPASPRISDGILEIARKLSLGLDSFVFLDDNPVEREWIRSQAPAGVD